MIIICYPMTRKITQLRSKMKNPLSQRKRPRFAVREAGAGRTQSETDSRP